MKADLAWTGAETLEGRGLRGLRVRTRVRQADLIPTLNTRIGIVLAVIVGQLWGLKLALDAWFGGQTRALWVIVACQALSSAITLAASRTQSALATRR